MQLFYWLGDGRQEGSRVQYSCFTLNGEVYHVGDACYLFPEDEQSPHFVGRIVSAFVDKSAPESDPHRIEVKWYERRTSFEPTTRGILESDREVFELEDTDVNPIGCISGKCAIIRAQCFDEARQMMQDKPEIDWFFCRGYFLQASNSFQAYKPEELDTNAPPPAPASPSEKEEPQPADGEAAEEPTPPKAPASAPAKRRSGVRGAPSTEKKEKEKPAPASAPPKPKNKRPAIQGRGVCVNCGATSTPQWREGPAGPKTLCNACGVRHVRMQQKKKSGSTGGPGKGKGGNKGAGNVAPSSAPASGAAVGAAAVAAAEEKAAAAPAAADEQPGTQTRAARKGPKTPRPEPPPQSRSSKRQAHQAPEPPLTETNQVPSKRQKRGLPGPTSSELPKQEAGQQEQPKPKSKRQQDKKEQQQQQQQQQRQASGVPDAVVDKALQPTSEEMLRQRRREIASLRDLLQQTSKYTGTPGTEQLLGMLSTSSSPLLDQPNDLTQLASLRERVAQQMREADAAEAASQAVLEIYNHRQKASQEAGAAASEASQEFRRLLSEKLERRQQSKAPSKQQGEANGGSGQAAEKENGVPAQGGSQGGAGTSSGKEGAMGITAQASAGPASRAGGSTGGAGNAANESNQAKGNEGCAQEGQAAKGDEGVKVEGGQQPQPEQQPQQQKQQQQEQQQSEEGRQENGPNAGVDMS